MCPLSLLLKISSCVCFYEFAQADRAAAEGKSQLVEHPVHYYPQTDNGRSLRDGKEIVVHLKAKEPKRYYFNVKEDSTPISIVVTPCGGVIKWKVTKRASHESSEEISDDDEEDFEAESDNLEDGGLRNDVDSDAFSEDDETIQEVDGHLMAASSHQKTQQKRAAAYEASSKDKSKLPKPKRDGLSVGIGSSQIGDEFQSPRKEGVLINEVGRTMMQYTGDSLAAGIIHLHLTSPESDSAVRVYLSTDARLAEFFPKLPRNNRLQVVNITKVSVDVEWEPSPTVNTFKRGDIQYCLVLSDAKQYYSYCQLNPEMNFDFHGSHDFYRNDGRDPKANSLFGAENGNWDTGSDVYYPFGRAKKPFVACTELKTVYRFDNLSPNSKYFLSLFAINVLSGGSVSYEGASFVTRGEKKGPDVVTLYDSRMIASYLNPARAAFKLYQFPVRHFHKNIMISLQPCSGSIRVQIMKDGRVVKTSVFEDLKTFILGNVKPGLISIKVVNDDNDAKIYKIWASTRLSRNPYPKLPFDTSIKILEQSRTCRSVTLAWLLTDEKHSYCLYKREEQDDYFKRLILEESDLCRGPRNMKKVFCKRLVVAADRLEQAEDLIFNTTVGSLKPATTYRFDLFASKPNRQPMSYRTIWVKTKPDCIA